MAETFTVSDQRAHTAMVMAVFEATAYEVFLADRAKALRAEADRIDAFLSGKIDGWSKPRMQSQKPSHEIQSWYDVIAKERNAAEKAARTKS